MSCNQCQSDENRKVEPRLSLPVNHYQLNAIGTCIRSGQVQFTPSEGGQGIQDLNARGTCKWQGMSKDELSFIQRKYTMPNTLNEVKGKPNNTTVLEASGSDFPHVVLLDFSQDMTLGGEEVGRSHPASAPICHG